MNPPAFDVLSSFYRLSDYVIAGDADDKSEAAMGSDYCLRQTGERSHPRPSAHPASVGAGAGLGLPIIGKLLGHRHPETTADCAHLDADPLGRASNQIGNAIAMAMDAGMHHRRVVEFLER
jgi:hypothetical protein